MNNELYQLINMIQDGDKNALFEVINKFNPLINKLSRKLNYEEANTDLVILFIQLLKSMNLTNFNPSIEGKLISFLNKSMNNKTIDLFKKNVIRKEKSVALNLDILSIEVDMDTKIFINQILNSNVITEKQKIVLKKSYLYGFSDHEIANSLNISRQAVNRTRNRALNSIRKYLKINLK